MLTLSISLCLSISLELCIGDAIKKEEAMANFKKVVSDIHALYSNSPKLKSELKRISLELHDSLLENNVALKNFNLEAFRTVFDIRWAFSSKAATDALLNNLPVLADHLQKIVNRLFKSLKKMKKNSKSNIAVKGKHHKLSLCF